MKGVVTSGEGSRGGGSSAVVAWDSPLASSTAKETPRAAATAPITQNTRGGGPARSTAVPEGGAETRRALASTYGELGEGRFRPFGAALDPPSECRGAEEVSPIGGAVLTEDLHLGQRAYPTGTEIPQFGHDLASIAASILAHLVAANFVAAVRSLLGDSPRRTRLGEKP